MLKHFARLFPNTVFCLRLFLKDSCTLASTTENKNELISRVWLLFSLSRVSFISPVTISSISLITLGCNIKHIFLLTPNLKNNIFKFLYSYICQQLFFSFFNFCFEYLNYCQRTTTYYSDFSELFSLY